MAGAQDDWIESRVNSAHEAYPVVEAVALTIKTQLREAMRERTLSRSELAALAETLLDAVNHPPDEEVPK